MTDKKRSSLADLQNQLILLQQEYAYEKEMFHEHTQRVGIQQRISQGGCWYPISIGKSYYNSLNQLTIEIIRSEMEEGESLFEHGRPISFFKIKMDGKLHYLNFSAVISYVQEDRMVVILPNAHALMELDASM